MIPILYPATETEFDSNGLGPLTDAIECTVTEERNGPYELTLRYPMTGDHYADIQRRCQIRANPASNRTMQTFRIYDISRPMGGIVTVRAQHISYDLSGIVAEPFEASSARQAMQRLQTATVPQNPFTMWTDKDTAGKMSNKAPASVRSLLGGREGSLLDLYGGEFEFDNRKVMLHTARGQDNGVTIRYGKNLTDLTQDENCASVRTAVYPYWAGQVQEEGQEEAKDTLITLPEKTVSAPGTYDFTSIMPLDLSGEWTEKPPTVEQLRDRATRYVNDNKIGVPRVSLTVKFAQLEQSEEYKGLKLLEQVNLCDTVTVIFPALGVDATAKCRKTTYNVLLDRMESVELGDARSSLADTVANNNQAIDGISGSLGKLESDVLGKIPSSNTIKSIAMSAAAQILGARGGAVRLLDTDNDGTPDTLYIADNPDPSQAVKVWRWNYEGWGASKKGYNGPFTMAATLEQGLVADFITAGTLSANLVKAGVLADEKGNFNLDLGTGICDIKKGNITLGPNDELKLTDEGRIEATSGKIGDFFLKDGYLESRQLQLGGENGLGRLAFGNGEEAQPTLAKEDASIEYDSVDESLEISVKSGKSIKFSNRLGKIGVYDTPVSITPNGYGAGAVDINADIFLNMSKLIVGDFSEGQSIDVEIPRLGTLEFTSGILTNFY